MKLVTPPAEHRLDKAYCNRTSWQQEVLGKIVDVDYCLDCRAVAFKQHAFIAC